MRVRQRHLRMPAAAGPPIADDGYLQSWHDALTLGAAVSARQPVIAPEDAIEEDKPPPSPVRSRCGIATLSGVHFVRLASVRITACLVVLSGLNACATIILPPESIRDPVEVIVIDHGRTTSLMIPSSDDGMLRYAYGDWNWYALGRHGLFRGIAALLWPTRGAVGRAEIDGVATAESVRAQVSSVQALHVVRVERARLRTFEKDMESRFDAGRNDQVENTAVGLRFVPHPRPYTYFWNSNHAVASWLRELGCETRGFSFGASWNVASARRPSSQ
jgi:hypothetical protein